MTWAQMLQMTWAQLRSEQGLLIVQLGFIVTQIISIIYLQWRLSIAQKAATRAAIMVAETTAREREAAILEVRRTADELAERTEKIAQDLRMDAFQVAQTTSLDVEHKLDTILGQFDAVGQQQKIIEELKQSVDETKRSVNATNEIVTETQHLIKDRNGA
jgi:uncharacterized protein YoxC